jgi:hypothetical protein
VCGIYRLLYDLEMLDSPKEPKITLEVTTRFFWVSNKPPDINRRAISKFFHQNRDHKIRVGTDAPERPEVRLITSKTPL